MDDLDHSMHIADYDWLSFYEDSEECCLLQPSLACPDNSSLSDSDGPDCSIYTCTDCTQPPVQLVLRPSDNHHADEDSVLPQDAEVLQKELSVVQCSDEGAAELESKVGQQPAESDLKATQEPEPPSSKGGVCDFVSSAGARAEKERWFVTVNVNPQHGVPGTSVKKKRKQKKMWKEDDTHTLKSDMCFDLDIITQAKEESMRASDTDSIQCCQDKYSECAEISLESSQIELITDVNKCLTRSLSKDHLDRESIRETTMYTNKPNDGLSSITDAPLSDSVESDEFAEVEFFSSCSHDSENYVSATETVEEPQHPSIQNAHLVNVDSSADRGMHFPDNSLDRSAVAMSYHESMGSQAHVEPSQTFPSVLHRGDNMPNENYSTCNEGTESTELCVSSDTTISNINSSALEKDQMNDESLPQSAPAVSADSPEAYVRAIGNTQSVYAISAFWDEMEKLTINDILHLKMRSMLPGETCSADELVGSTGNVAGPSENNSIISSLDCNLADSVVLDMSDTADSDYFTHVGLDEPKQDRSSCDFSTSDFEDEYWQFMNSSRNSSPDHQDRSPQSHRTGYSSFSTYEEESLSSEEMGTPVPSEDCSGQQWPSDCTFTLCDIPYPQQIRKNKSMYNVHALNALEDLSLQSFFDPSCCRPLEESVPLKISDSLEVATCAPIMCYTDEQYQISFPQVFEYLFTDDKAKYEAMSVTLYGLQEIPKSPALDYTLCAVDSDLPLISFCDSQCSEEPIPIFSCAHPTVRELTFPKPGYIFLGTNSMTLADISPIRVVSQSLIRNFNCKHTDRSYWFSQDLSSLFSIKKICFHDKGYDAWEYQVETEKTPVDAIDFRTGVVTEVEAPSLRSKLFGDTAVRQIPDTQISTNYQSIFSTIKQSDMCLVCIAFASWVLRSSDPEAADAWKAALLANVSALSAIQYLRQYMKKKAPPQDDL